MNHKLLTDANPVAEIWPKTAKAAGARIVATGRSDFDNQLNNSLVFPGLFRRVLDSGASTVTDEMVYAAARQWTGCSKQKQAENRQTVSLNITGLVLRPARIDGFSEPRGCRPF